MIWDIIGMIAGFICLSSLFPQIYKGYKTKKLDDLSYFLMIFLAIGVFLWVLYGIHISSWPLIIANSLIVIFSSILIVMKFRYKRRDKK